MSGNSAFDSPSASTFDQGGIRVVHIVARLNVGGPARHIAWLIAGLRQAGYESLLVSGTVPPSEGDMRYFVTAQGIEPLIIPGMSREISFFQDLRTIWKLYRLFLRLRPEIVDTHTAKAGVVGRMAGLLYRWLTPAVFVGRPRRCRFVHTFHGHIFHSYYGASKTCLFLNIEKILARVATDRIIVVSPQQYHEIHDHYGVGRADQFTIIPYGIDLLMFAGWGKRRSVMRDELWAKDADILVGIVGRLTEVKNHRMFLQAAALYKKRYGTASRRRVRFLLIGDGHLQRDLEDQVNALGLDGDVVFLGRRDDPENFYPALDIVALTSFNEGMPFTLIEAMANARPVIATAVGGVIDLLGNAISSSEWSSTAFTVRERGLLVCSNDAEAFCRGLALFIEDEQLRRVTGERGEAFIKANLSTRRLIGDVKNLYRQLMSDDSGIGQYEEGVNAQALKHK